MRSSPRRISVVGACAAAGLAVVEVAGWVVRLSRREERTQFMTWLRSQHTSLTVNCNQCRIYREGATSGREIF